MPKNANVICEGSSNYCANEYIFELSWVWIRVQWIFLWLSRVRNGLGPEFVEKNPLVPSNKPLTRENWSKAITYDEQTKMKRSAGQKAVPEKKTAFLSDISLHFRLFVEHYGLKCLLFFFLNDKIYGYWKKSFGEPVAKNWCKRSILVIGFLMSRKTGHEL